MTPVNVFKREARLIVAFIVVAVALLGVIHLGSEIREDGTLGFDRWLILALRQPGDLGRPIGPGWLRPAFVDITALGGVTALTLLTVTVTGYLIVGKRLGTAALLAAATISGSLVGQVLKFTFVRTRPAIVPHFVEIHTLSYPSGHAVNSSVVFLTLGALLVELAGRGLRNTSPPGDLHRDPRTGLLTVPTGVPITHEEVRAFLEDDDSL